MQIERPRGYWLELVWFGLALVFALILFAIFSCRPSPAAWGSGSGPVGPIVSQQAPAFTGWQKYKDCLYYYRDGQQIAGWNPETKVYRTYDAKANVWSEPEEPPWQETTVSKITNCDLKGCGCSAACKCGKDCKCKAGTPCAKGGCGPDCPTAAPIQQLPTGVEWDKVPAGEHYLIEGLEVTEAEAKAVVKQAGGGTVPDDAGQLRLTVIGTPAECKPLVDDLATSPKLAPYQGKLVVQAYQPTDVLVAKYGFVTTGHPTIYVQRPDATVVYRQDSYQGPDALAMAIRKANPDYDSKKDPNGNQPSLPSLPAGSAPFLILAGGFGLAYLIGKKRGKS